MRKEEIKLLLHKGYSREVISFGFNIPEEEIKQIENEMNQENTIAAENQEATKFSESIAPKQDKKTKTQIKTTKAKKQSQKAQQQAITQVQAKTKPKSKMQQIREIYRKMYSEDLILQKYPTTPITPQSEEEKQKVQHIIEKSKQAAEKIIHAEDKTAMTKSISELSNQINQTKNINITFAQATELFELLSDEFLQDIKTKSNIRSKNLYEHYGKLIQAKKTITTELIGSVEKEADSTNDLNKLEAIYGKIPKELKRNMRNLQVSNKISRIQKKNNRYKNRKS